jgi:probable addiction module antidote protein
MRTKTRTHNWNAAEHLDSPSLIAAYLEAALVEAKGDPQFLLTALNTVARAGNFSELSREVGMSRKGLYKALSADGNPSFTSIMQLLNTLGVEVHFNAQKVSR